MSQPNINYMMEMTKDYIDGKIEIISFALDFPYELEKRYKKMHRLLNFRLISSKTLCFF